MAWTVYIIRCRDDTLYTGIATDVKARLDAHREGKGSRYTRSRRPLRLVYQERVRDRSAALRRELQIKRLSRKEKLALIAGARRRRGADRGQQGRGSGTGSEMLYSRQPTRASGEPLWPRPRGESRSRRPSCSIPMNGSSSASPG
ncbi:MAG: GIY-YIG nuclease family protein [Candidatus Riflebacteria bacterium]|nr:GIY-YIG nuclease family protein [Candidatus Riflebacteria bacterium]